MRRLLALVLAVSVVAGAAGAAADARRGQPQPPQFPTLPGVWSHSELNVKIAGQWHTMILDHGRVIQSSPTGLTLREPDGSVVPVPLSATTIVRPARLALVPPALRRGLFAITMRIDGGPAVRVRLMLRP